MRGAIGAVTPFAMINGDVEMLQARSYAWALATGAVHKTPHNIVQKDGIDEFIDRRRRIRCSCT